jgi:2-phosphosulfolactate phosphatase
VDVQLLLTPYPLDRVEVPGKTAVVIDVLRSSTSVCASLLAGARSVIPTAGPGEAGELWTKLGAENAVLAGERQGVKIENFQYGNSPTEFTPNSVGGKNVILCTTNGTGIFGRVAKADLVLSCAFVNVTRVAQELARAGRDTIIVCAGREGGFSIEDTLCGGMLIELLKARCNSELTLNDAASLARLLYADKTSVLSKAVAEGEHGRFLGSIGLGRDLEICASVDTMPTLPVLIDGRLTIQEEK